MHLNTQKTHIRMQKFDFIFHFYVVFRFAYRLKIASPEEKKNLRVHIRMKAKIVLQEKRENPLTLTSRPDQMHTFM